MKTRCKMRCHFVKTYEHDLTREINMSPVIDGSEENKKFWKYTPGGRLDFYCANPDVNIEAGKDYYIDISLAE